MKGFEPAKFKWAGAEYEVPANRILMLAAEVEDALRGNSHKQAVELLMQPGGPGTARLSMAYAAALQFAGASVTGDEVYLSIMGGLAEQDPGALVQIQNAILTLLALIAPPITAALMADVEGNTEKKTSAAE